MMRGLIRLAAMLTLLFAGGVALIKLLYDVSWSESLEIPDQFVEDLLA